MRDAVWAHHRVSPQRLQCISVPLPMFMPWDQRILRHGSGTTFLSGALGIEPDAITFGKAIAAGVDPLSGIR